MTQCSLHRRSLAYTITDVTAYATLSLVLLSFLSHPSISLSLLFSFTFLLLPFIPLCLSRGNTIFFPPTSFTTSSSTVCASLSVGLPCLSFFSFSCHSLFILSHPSLYVCHSSVLKVNVADWLDLSSVCQPEKKKKAQCSQSGTLFLSLCAW